MLEPRDCFRNSLSLCHAHQSDAGRIERTPQRIAIHLGNDGHIDFVCYQCINRLCIIQIHKAGRRIQPIGGFQNLQHKQSQSASRHADGKALAAQLTEKRDRLVVSIKNENCCIEYSPKRIERVGIARLRDAEGRKGSLHP